MTPEQLLNLIDDGFDRFKLELVCDCFISPDKNAACLLGAAIVAKFNSVELAAQTISELHEQSYYSKSLHEIVAQILEIPVWLVHDISHALIWRCDKEFIMNKLRAINSAEFQDYIPCLHELILWDMPE